MHEKRGFGDYDFELAENPTFGETNPGMPNFDCRGAGVDVMLLYDDPQNNVGERSMSVGTRSWLRFVMLLLISAPRLEGEQACVAR